VCKIIWIQSKILNVFYIIILDIYAYFTLLTTHLFGKLTLEK